MTNINKSNITFGQGNPMVLIAGPCVIESEGHAHSLAQKIREIADKTKTPYVFKASFDKANRTSINSFRGPGIKEGLRILGDIKKDYKLPILTDIHEPRHAEIAAEVVDVIQIPAFLCRQTDLLFAASKTGKTLNIKKGQFLAPLDLKHVIQKITDSGNSNLLITERGTSFGYNNLVVDIRSLPILRTFGFPVIFDVTHSLQLPGAGDGVTAGQAEFIDPLASAGVAAGVDGIFMEVHEDPKSAKSDGQNALQLDRLEPLLKKLTLINDAVKSSENETDPKN